MVVKVPAEIYVVYKPHKKVMDSSIGHKTLKILQLAVFMRCNQLMGVASARC